MDNILEAIVMSVSAVLFVFAFSIMIAGITPQLNEIHKLETYINPEKNIYQIRDEVNEDIAIIKGNELIATMKHTGMVDVNIDGVAVPANLLGEDAPTYLVNQYAQYSYYYDIDSNGTIIRIVYMQI